MNKVKLLRFFAICAISIAFATPSIALGQTYTQVDYPGAIATEVNGGPDLEGTSVGSWEDTSGILHGFWLTAKGKFVSFDPPGSTSTTPNFININGVIVGSYLDSSSVSHGFILNAGKYTTLDAPGAAGTILSAINNQGEMSGSSCTDPACSETGNPSTDESFIRYGNGTYKFFNPPGAASSQTSTVSATGAVVGIYTDSSGNGFGYLRAAHGTTTISFPDALLTYALGANVRNQIVGAYFDSSFAEHGFAFDNGAYRSFDVPNSTFTAATGVNAANVIVGVFGDSSGADHGFIRTPKN
jgi:hypothetical protein